MAKEAECREDFSKLFEKCESMNERIAVTENNIHHIVNSSKNIEDNVQKFIEAVNGKPISNEENIKALKAKVQSNSNKIIYYSGGLAATFIIIGIILAILFS